MYFFPITNQNMKSSWQRAVCIFYLFKCMQEKVLYAEAKEFVFYAQVVPGGEEAEDESPYEELVGAY